MTEFHDLNKVYLDLTGRDLFAYATQPYPNGQTKYVFQETILTNRTAALAYMRMKIAEAKAQVVMSGVDHTYQPGETYYQHEQTPLCAICGQPKHGRKLNGD